MDELEKKWRFPGNNYSTEAGLDTSDMETFKKDPLASLAREVCQNSVDARAETKEKVIIEFSSFIITKDKIPGRECLEQQIESCIKYQRKKENEKEVRLLIKMLEEIKKEKIECLRISDFNTKGLLGVTSTENKPFYLLTKGSGITNKIGTSGGSKGIGKYASFVASSFNTVFYSTYNVEGEKGYIGISKLTSTNIPNSEEKTQGIGFFGINRKNSPIEEQLNLGEQIERNSPGTDIYILGFRKEETWIKEVITKVLDSFMSAVVFGELEIIIEKIDINQSTLESIINNEELILNSEKNNIKSQYILLTEKEGVKTREIEIDEYGKAKIYLKGFSKEESVLATNDCVMIRYPYMKIKALKNISSIPCSAICIIPNNKLNEILREIENPQHTDWEVKRLNDMSFRNEVKNIIRKLQKGIGDFVYEVLSSSENIEIDIEGASDFLPEVDKGDGNSNEEEKEQSEKPRILKKVEAKIKSKIGLYDDESGSTLQPNIGSHEEGEDSPIPVGINHGRNGEPHDSPEEEKPNEDGDNDILRKIQLSGIQYRFFVVSKELGKYVVSFNFPYEKEEDCELEMYYLDDSDTKYKVNIKECYLNGQEQKICNGRIVEISMKSGKSKFEITTDLKELYAYEVKMYANR